jgi:hypothetical protein
MGVGGSDASSGVGGSALNDDSSDTSDASIEASKDSSSDRVAFDVTEAGIAGFCAAVGAAQCPNAPDPTDCGKLFNSSCPAAQACASCAGPAPTIGCLDGGLGFSAVGCETLCNIGQLSACFQGQDAGIGDASMEARADASGDRVTSDVAFDVTEASVAGFCTAVGAAQCPNAPDPTDCGRLFTSDCAAAQACASCAGSAPTINCLDGGLGFTVIGCETLCAVGHLSVCFPGQDAGDASVE